MDTQSSFDLSGLPGNDVEISPPAAPAKPAQPVVKTKKKKKAKKQARKQAKQAEQAPSKLTFTVENLQDEDFTVESLFAPVYESGLVLGVTRQAWNGVRSKKASKRVQGLRVRMRIDGYEIIVKVEAPDGNGRLASAVYAKGDDRLVITYGTEPGYGHTIKAVEDK
jgi:hypothetical protein